ncbi:MAG TPA: hypothetical protein VI874_00595 [Candidatus Norongarragalinales archaeon]|nr:hypothetical protein [Candidatus Norongarragalinales archaeon]
MQRWNLKQKQNLKKHERIPMAIMKKSKRKELTREDAQSELTRLEREIQAEVSARGSQGKPKNSGKFREMRRFRATLLQLLAQKASVQKSVLDKNRPDSSVKSVAVKPVQKAAGTAGTS